MVAEYFNKYDNKNFVGCKTETTIHGIHEGVVIDAYKKDNGFLMNDSECSNEEKEGMNDPIETRRSTDNIKDPTGIDLEILLCEVETPLNPSSPSNRLTSTLMLLMFCTAFAVPNKFVNELLKDTNSPRNNTLNKLFYKEKCLLMKL